MSTNFNIDEYEDYIRQLPDSGLMEQYHSLKENSDEIKGKLSAIKEEVAERLHKKQQNEMIFELPDPFPNYKAAYQTRTTKRTNYSALMEHVGINVFSEIVSENESTSLSIRAIKKGKKSRKSKTRSKPIENETKIPTGLLS